MSNPGNISPAVQSIRREKERQAVNGAAGDLDDALKDTFPASDPISASGTTMPSRHTADRSGSRWSGEMRGHTRPRSAADAGATLDAYVTDLARSVRERPLAAAAIVAAAAWLFGRTR
ncbi:hypothetical protein ACLE20_00025 [Rhizobium sp. YIM 134829]|uniref:hypothetical protein n=1 Tax=Rhizobium sp. YIM 134829 TaxID=3390453 RepID=UPI00397B85F7